jgi:hypothetical protein
VREFWRKQPKWLWAIAGGVVLIELGGALMAMRRRGVGTEVRVE